MVWEDFKGNLIGCLGLVGIFIVIVIVATGIFQAEHGGHQSVQVMAGTRECWNDIILVSAEYGTAGEARWTEGSAQLAAGAPNYQFSIIDSSVFFNYDIDIRSKTIRNVDANTGQEIMMRDYEFTYDYCIGVPESVQPGTYNIEVEVRFGHTATMDDFPLAVVMIPYEVEVMSPGE